MPSHNGLFINGEWVQPHRPGELRVTSPHDGSIVGHGPAAGDVDVDRAVAAARSAFDHGPWPQLTLAERVDYVKALVGKYETRVTEMAKLITREMGSPIGFSQAVQVYASILLINSCIDTALQYPFEEGRKGLLGTTVVRREPVGVVAAIVPWNTPQVTALTKLIPALIVGCTTVLKPAPETPLDGLLLGRIIDEVGLPDGVVNIITGGREVGERLVTHPAVDKVAFTGSTAAGRRIAALCGADLRRVTLELGGKSAAIVLDDADLAVTVEGLRMASFMNSGQTCVAQTRILASRRNYDNVVGAVAELAASLRVGDPMDPQTDIGPLVSRRQQERVANYIAVGRSEGARVVQGDRELPAELKRGCYIRPTVFANADNSMRISREEIFGPVVTVIPYVDVDDAIRIANDSPYGLAGSIWTADVEQGIDIARHIRAGSLGINQYALDFVAPGGGFKDSGIGREGGPEGFDAFVETKSVLARTGDG